MNKLILGFNDVATTHPHLLEEWDYEKNTIKPTEISAGSRTKVWWRGKTCGHSWDASLSDKVRKNTRCPFCTNRRVLTGFNDLKTVFPSLAEEWDYEKNDFSPAEVVAYSSKRVFWRGKICGHSWDAIIDSRIQNKSGCPYCAGIKVLSGFNDIATTHPHLLEEWDYEKNTIKPTEISAGSRTKVWWVSKTCGHSWDMSVKEKRRDWGCPYCSNHRILIGFNDMATTHPHLLEEWDYEKNTIKPTEITYGSVKTVYWKCKKCNNSWSAYPNSRTACDSGCPYCAGDKVKPGFNDIATTHPHLLEEWDYEKNTIKPTEISAGSNTRVWWKCKTCEHSWFAAINNRTKEKSTGCPKCHAANTSYPEQFIWFYLHKVFPTAKNKSPENRPNWLCRKEIDIIIPEKNVAIEYDGVYFHKDAEVDNLKSKLCNQNEIRMIRVREHGCPILKNNNDFIIHVKPNCINDLRMAVIQLLQILDVEDIEIQEVLSKPFVYKHVLQHNLLSEKYPYITKYWDSLKNGQNPNTVHAGSKLKYYFICENCKTSHQMGLPEKIRQYNNKQKCLCHACSRKIRK